MKRNGEMASRRVSGWRRLAAFNILGMSVLSIILLALLVFSSIRAGGLSKVLVLLDRPCHETERLNLWLHLVTNIISTVILASANFFMQILTAPSRQEIDIAHAKKTYVEIGVQSLLNFPQLRKAKLRSWIGLLLTSLPLHLFFNSVVFETANGVSRHLTVMAAEPWLHGASYSPMGASLTPLEYTDVDDYYDGASSFITNKLADLAKTAS